MNSSAQTPRPTSRLDPLLQRRMDLPDATVLVLQGFIFVAILASETLQGRYAWFQPRRVDS